MHNFLRLTYNHVFLLLALGFLASCTTTSVDKQEFLMAPEFVGTKDGKVEKTEEWYQSSGDGVYKLGKPYKVNGVWYFPAENLKYDEIGYAGVYGPDFDNQRTANGEIYRKEGITASHKTLPLPSIARVTNLANNISIIVRINDRGPFSNDRLVDLSERASKMLEFGESGPSRVRIEILPEESKKAADLLTYGKKVEDRLLVVPEIAQSSPEVTVTQNTGQSEDVVGQPVVEATNPEVPSDDDAQSSEQSSQEPVSEANIAALAHVLGNTPAADTSEEASLTSDVVAVSESEPGAPELTPVVEESATVSPVAVQETDSAGSHEIISTASIVPNSNYYIQAGTFGVKQNAVNLSTKLAHLAKTSITPVDQGVRKLNRVDVGPFSNKKDAEKILAYVKQAMGLSDAKLLKR